MSSVASKCFSHIEKKINFFHFAHSLISARAISNKILLSRCSIRTCLTHIFSTNLKNKMSGDLCHKRLSHYKAAVLKESGEKLQITELKNPSKLKGTQVLIFYGLLAKNFFNKVFPQSHFSQVMVWEEKSSSMDILVLRVELRLKLY